MQIIFSKSAFIIAGITFFFALIAYVIGYFMSGSGSFLHIPIIQGVLLAGIVLSIVAVASILFIIFVLKSKYILIGYLILTIGGCIVVAGSFYAKEELSEYVKSSNRQKKDRNYE